MEFITNQSQSNHLQKIQQILDGAEEVFIAVAYLKMSGLSHVEKQLKQLAREKVPVTMVVGLNFAITDPAALNTLYRLKKRFENFAIYLGRNDKKSQSFHPKIYASRKGKRFQLLSGSANLTNGGLSTNHEASLFLEGSTQAEIWKNMEAHFEFLSSKMVSKPITQDLLDEYSKFHQNAKENRPKDDFEFDAAPKKIDIETGELLKSLTKSKRKELSMEFARREAQYEKARQVLWKMARAKKTSKEQFMVYLSQLIRTRGKGEWFFQSGGLPRSRPNVLDNYEGLIKIIKAAHSLREESPKIAFGKVKELADGYRGIGVNLISEILMAINPENFANINKKPIGVICSISGSKIKKTYQIYNGNDYQVYCDTVKEINERLSNEKLSFSNFIQSDAFFNDFYEQLKADSRNGKVGTLKRKTPKSGSKKK